MSIITLTTDFGGGSHYVAAMKGVILSIHPAATLIDITHDIPPQDIRAAALLLDNVADWYPPETVHLAVVDPDVGTDRAMVYARMGQHHFIAPDNGILSRLAMRKTTHRLIQLAEPAFWREPVSCTFHGRDIMAPAAAHVAMGIDPERLGPPLERLVMLNWAAPKQLPTRIDGEVIEIDSFGNLITNITTDMLAGRPTDRRACVVCNIYETWGIYRTYADLPGGMLIALVGSSGRLELAIVRDNAAKRLGIEAGSPVTIAWEA